MRRTRKVTRPGLLGGRFGTEPGGGTVSPVGRPDGLPTSFWMLREIPRTRDTARACCCRTRDQLHVGGLTAIILRLEREGAALSRLFSFLRGGRAGHPRVRVGAARRRLSRRRGSSCPPCRRRR